MVWDRMATQACACGNVDRPALGHNCFTSSRMSSIVGNRWKSRFGGLEMRTWCLIHTISIQVLTNDAAQPIP